MTSTEGRRGADGTVSNPPGNRQDRLEAHSSSHEEVANGAHRMDGRPEVVPRAMSWIDDQDVDQALEGEATKVLDTAQEAVQDSNSQEHPAPPLPSQVMPRSVP